MEPVVGGRAQAVRRRSVPPRRPERSPAVDPAAARTRPGRRTRASRGRGSRRSLLPGRTRGAAFLRCRPPPGAGGRRRESAASRPLRAGRGPPRRDPTSGRRPPHSPIEAAWPSGVYPKPCRSSPQDGRCGVRGVRPSGAASARVSHGRRLLPGAACGTVRADTVLDAVPPPPWNALSALVMGRRQDVQGFAPAAGDGGRRRADRASAGGDHVPETRLLGGVRGVFRRVRGIRGRQLPACVLDRGARPRDGPDCGPVRGAAARGRARLGGRRTTGRRRASAWTTAPAASSSWKGAAQRRSRGLLRDGPFHPYQWVVRHFRGGRGARGGGALPCRRGAVRLPGDAGGGCGRCGPRRRNGPAPSPRPGPARPWNVALDGYEPVEASPGRASRGAVSTTRSSTSGPAGRRGEGRFRLRLVVSGDRLTELMHVLQVPEAFDRRYEAMRAANEGYRRRRQLRHVPDLRRRPRRRADRAAAAAAGAVAHAARLGRFHRVRAAPGRTETSGPCCGWATTPRFPRRASRSPSRRPFMSARSWRPRASSRSRSWPPRACRGGRSRTTCSSGAAGRRTAPARGRCSARRWPVI